MSFAISWALTVEANDGDRLVDVEPGVPIVTLDAGNCVETRGCGGRETLGFVPVRGRLRVVNIAEATKYRVRNDRKPLI